jgi:hypothetical protein
MILDIRDVRAAVGLTAGVGWSNSNLDSYQLPESWSWVWYEWLRECARLTAQRDTLQLVEFERALFQVDGATVKALNERWGKGDWKWSQYLPEARSAAQRICSRTS